MVVEARILIRYLSTLYQRFRRPDYSTWRRAHVNLWRNDREFQRHTYWNLQFIHDRLDGYVPNHIFSTTLARIHRRQSFIFYASHAAEHNMTMEITTNEWTSSAAAISICNYIAPQGFSKFFPIFTTTLTSLTLHGGACDMVFQNMLLVGSYSAGVYETAYLDYFTAVTM